MAISFSLSLMVFPNSDEESYIDLFEMINQEF